MCDWQVHIWVEVGMFFFAALSMIGFVIWGVVFSVREVGADKLFVKVAAAAFGFIAGFAVGGVFLFVCACMGLCVSYVALVLCGNVP